MTTTASGIQFGINGKLYYCTAGIGGTPTWTLFPGVKDVTLNIDGKEVDVTTRAAAGFQLSDIATMDASIEFDLPLDPADVNYQAIETAFFARSVIGLACMSSAITDINSRGLWADCKITKFDRDENIEGAMIVKVTAKPTHSANAPLWKVISGS